MLKLAAGPLAGAASMQDDTVTTSAKRAGVIRQQQATTWYGDRRNYGIIFQYYSHGR